MVTPKRIDRKWEIPYGTLSPDLAILKRGARQKCPLSMDTPILDLLNKARVACRRFWFGRTEALPDTQAEKRLLAANRSLEQEVQKLFRAKAQSRNNYPADPSLPENSNS